MAKTTDKFSNVLTEEISMSAANTLTFEEVNIGLSLFDKAGILISRVEYSPYSATMQEMTAAADWIQLAFCTSNQLSNLAVTQAAVVHQVQWTTQYSGAAASGYLVHTPKIVDLSTLPGGGILITPRPWYVAMNTNGLASAGGGYVRFYFTVLQLQPQEYFELLETRSYFG